MSYMTYMFVLYFAFAFSIKDLSDHKNDFPTCRKMLVYSGVFLGFYCVDTLRFVIYILMSIFSSDYTAKFGISMCLVNILMFAYGVLLVYTGDKDCVTEYDIKDYLTTSGVGIICFILTYTYHNYDQCFGTIQPRTSERYFLIDSTV